MPEFQTSVQDLYAILRGSGKLEFSAYQETPSYIDAGSLSGLEIDEVMEVNKEENDNVDADELVTKQEVNIKATLHEALRSSVWDLLRGSFDTKTVVAAAPDTDNQDFAANTTAAGVLYPLAYKNASGTCPTVAVSGDPLGTPDPYTVDVDYKLVKDDNGIWYIYFISGVDYTVGEMIRLAITYTPAASVMYQSGDQSVLPWFSVRITTKNDGKAWYFVGYKAKIKVGKKMTFPKDDDSDRRVKVPIEIVCKPDPLYTHNGKSNMIYETVQVDGF